MEGIKNILKLFLIVVLVLVPKMTMAEMQSSNYKVPKDVLESTGGESTSTNYKIIHSLGESVVGYSSSSSYHMDSGFLQPEIAVLSCSLSQTDIDLGVFATNNVSTGSTVLTLSTSAAGGYNVKAYDDTDPGIANGMISGDRKIADATTPNVYIDLPTAGTEHYGVTVTGSNASAGYASGTKINSMDDTTWIDIASYTSFIEDDQVTIQFRASISGTTAGAKDYSANTHIICYGNY